MTEHSPGPWRVVRNKYVTKVVDEEGSTICCNEDCYSTAVLEEDMELIAAAPDLLAACKEFVRKCDAGEARSTRSYAEMKAAIAKAEGWE